MKILDLFSGIGGFSLGLERAGMKTVAFCELEDYPISILKKHWPDVPVYRDVRKLDGKQFRGTVELICGGFPCQPFSVAGKQRGKEDDRHLWPEMLRLIQEVRPTWVIGENVAGFITMALDDVLSDLEAEGYTCQPFVIPACAVGGVHRRDRVWIVAYSELHANQRKIEGFNGKEEELEGIIRSENSATRIISRTGNDGCASKLHAADPKGKQCKGKQCNGISDDGKSCESQKPESGNSDCQNVTDTDNKRLQGQQITGSNEKIRQKSRDKQSTRFSSPRDFEPIGIPTEPPVRHRDDGLSDNVARLKALGNAVVPQIPEMIGRAIMEISK